MRHGYRDEDSWIVCIYKRESEKGEGERERDRGYRALSSIHSKELGGLISALPGNRRLSTICTLLRPLSISFSISLSLSPLQRRIMYLPLSLTPSLSDSRKTRPLKLREGLGVTSSFSRIILTGLRASGR